MNHLNLYCKSTRAGPPPAKRREKSLFSSTSSKATDVSMNPPNPPPPRRVLAPFRRGNTPGSQPSASTSTSGPQKSGTTQTRRTLRPRPADNPPIAFLASHIDSDCDSVGSKAGYVPPEVEEMDEFEWSEEEAYDTSGPKKPGTTQTMRSLRPRPAGHPSIAFQASHIDSGCDSVRSKDAYVPPEVEETDDHDWLCREHAILREADTCRHSSAGRATD
ncbi:hypothetical protein FRC05_002501 [Tulasnella sp. 425]|nr:hypothetical protein FRC05_002501 [Tulasnella sp. 425]